MQPSCKVCQFFVAVHVYLMQILDACLTYTDNFVDNAAILIFLWVQENHFHRLWLYNGR